MKSCVFFKLFHMVIYYIILSPCYLPFFFENNSLSNHFLQFQTPLSQLYQFLMLKIQVFWDIMSCWLVKLPVFWWRRPFTTWIWRWRHYATLHSFRMLVTIYHVTYQTTWVYINTTVKTGSLTVLEAAGWFNHSSSVMFSCPP